MIDELRLLPKNTEVWSIALQRNIQFSNDVIIRVTNTCIGSNDAIFARIQTQLGIMIPYLVDDRNGDISLLYSQTLPYVLPHGLANFEMTYDN